MTWDTFEHIALVAIVANTILQYFWYFDSKKH